MKLGCGIAPITDYRARGINVALGTDGAASNNRLDLFGEMRLAALLAKVATGDPAALPAADALRAATLGGAQALGILRRPGIAWPRQVRRRRRRRPGHAGSRALTIPCCTSCTSSAACVTDVGVAGQRLVADRVLTTVDEAALFARARLWQERLQ